MANVKYLSYDGLQYLVNKIKIHAIAERITYNDLVTKRNNGELQFGKYYMITDYVTIVNHTVRYTSIEEGFAIIVLATSERTLSEEAFAYDINEGYFSDNNANLNAWKLWYCLDNDVDRFIWASEDGKGVIYRMIDEHGNDCPYDFKNIKFRRFKLNLPITTNTRPYFQQILTNIRNQITNNSLSYIWGGTGNDYPNGKHYWESSLIVYSEILNDAKLFFTFSHIVSIDDNNILDLSITGENCKNNVIKEYYKDNILELNNIVFFNTYTDSSCYSNTFDNNCYNNSFDDSFAGNNFGTNCHDNSSGSRCAGNIFGDGCYYNNLSSSCHSNNFGDTCYSNSLNSSCYSNIFGNNCYYNVFNTSCFGNSFGNNCYYNISGGRFVYNILGNYCYNNSFGSTCSYNSLGNNCYANSFDSFCYDNSFGNNNGSNSLGAYCTSNSFSNNCHGNRFYNDCYNNSFGNNCDNNRFGSYCYYNSFGNDCKYNSFNIANSELSALRNYCYFNHFDDGCSFNVIWNESTSSDSNKLQNVHMKRGVIGVDSKNRNIINITTLNNKYCITVANPSDGGDLLIYCEEDCLSNDEIDTIF